MLLSTPIHVTTPLGDALQLRSMSGTEELGRLFCFDVELVSRDATIDCYNQTYLFFLGKINCLNRNSVSFIYSVRYVNIRLHSEILLQE